MEHTQRIELTSTGLEEDFQFSYSRPEFPWLRRALIRSVEFATGQPRLARMYRDWAMNPPRGENIFAAAMRLMNINIDTDFQAWRNLPRTGPLLIIANHPYGVLDGLAIGYLSTLVRSDVKIMTHSLLCNPPEVQRFVLPVDFGGTESAQKATVATRKRAREWLRDGHVVVVFPSGGVSTSVTALRGPAVDDPWHPFIASLSRVEGVKIVPVFFHGQNSRIFQIASHVYYPLRLALLFRESVKLMNRQLKVSIGQMVTAQDVPQEEDRWAYMRHLRRMVYTLSGPEGPDGSSEHVWPKHISFT
jgi:putative hemolysin